MIFQALLLFGAAGFIVMAAMGFVHTSTHSSGGHGANPIGGTGHGSGGHAASHGPVHNVAHVDSALASSTPQAHHGLLKGKHTSGSASGPGVGSFLKSAALLLVSPLDIFSLAMATGMAGLLLQKVAPSPLLWPLCLACGIAFDIVVTRGILAVAMKFAATPAEGLEGMVSKLGRATAAFGADGKGVIEVVADGQQATVLAILDKEEAARGVRIAKGDKLLILEVDSKRNCCRVSKDLGEPGLAAN